MGRAQTVTDFEGTMQEKFNLYEHFTPSFHTGPSQGYSHNEASSVCITLVLESNGVKRPDYCHVKKRVIITSICSEAYSELLFLGALMKTKNVKVIATLLFSEVSE